MIKDGEGELVVVRRPTSRTAAHNYVPCTICLGFFHKDCMFLHIKACPLRDHGNAVKPTNSAQEGIMMLMPYLPKTDYVQRVIISGMKDTEGHEGWYRS